MAGTESTQRRLLHPQQPSETPPHEERRRSRSREPGIASVQDQADPSVSQRQEVERKIQEIKSLVDAELKNSISADALKTIKKHSLDLASKIEQLQKTNARIVKNNEDIEKLLQGRIPNTCKPCSVPFETTLWDSILPCETLRTFSVVFPEGISLRESRERLHRAYLERMKQYDQLVAQKQREDLRLATKKSVFVQKCLETRATQNTLWKDLDLDLEEDVSMKGMSVEHLSAKATVIYTRTVDRAASFLKTKKELEAKSQLQKDRLLTALSQKAPVDFLNEAIDKRIVLAQQQPKTKQRKPLSSSVNAAAAFVSTTSNTSMNKDDFAPFVSEPLTAKGTGKFARPGPVQNKGKGKGVSSAKGNQKSKGKGKSINIDSDNWRSNSWRHHPGTTLQLNSMGLLRVESPSKSQFFTSVGKEKAKEERLETPAKEKTKARPRGSQRDPRSDTATFPAFDQGHVHL